MVIHISSRYFVLGLTIRFPVTFGISFYISEIPKYRKEIKGHKYIQSNGRLENFFLWTQRYPIYLLYKFDKLIYITRVGVVILQLFKRMQFVALKDR